MTRGILQDSTVDAHEARVLKRWLEEHQRGDEFANLIGKLSNFLTDGFVDRFESAAVVNMLGWTLAQLNKE